MSYLTIKKDAFIASAEDLKLPKGYQKVDYIESLTREEWLDTGVLSSSSLQMQGKVYAPASEDDKKYVYSVENSVGGAATTFNVTSSGSWRVRCDGTDYEGLASGVSTITFDINRSRAVINDVTVATYSCDDYGTTERTMYIFGTSSGLRIRSDKGDKGTMRLYWFKIYSDGTLIRDFIPCLDTSGTACLFDRVNQTTYYNKGGGTLTYG